MTNLQVPISTDLKKSALEAAKEHGFSSLQEAVRVILTKFAKREISFNVGEPVIHLSPKAVKRYNKILDEIDKGKNVYRAESIDDLMKHLNED
ncbi:MAG TPA: hypothetical protein VF185_00595 [Patescibacteria group bacterium]